MVNIENSSFDKAIKGFDLKPIIGTDAMKMFPIILIIFFILNLFKFNDKIMSKISDQRFEFSKEFYENSEKLLEGK